MNGEKELFPGGRLIADLKVGEKVDWYYRVLEVEVKKKKDGSDFLSLVLMDRSGQAAGKIWDNAARYHKLIEKGGIYRFSGEAREYQGKLEIHILRLTPLSGREKDFNADDYVATAPFDVAALFAETREILKANIADPFLVRLVDEFFQEYGESLQQHPGALKIHHAYPGGLLEHTCCLLKLALAVAGLYGLDRELLLVGALLHDAGKIFEFQVQPAPETTLAGGLLGHIVIGNNIFLELARRIEGFPAELSLKIQHLIVAHHGEKEYGSPEVPRIPEAYALHLLDLLDSRLNIFRELGRRSEARGLFSEFNHTLGTRILLEKE